MSKESIHKRFLNAVDRLGLSFKVAQIAEKMGVGEPIVSMYLNSRRTVSLKFVRTFCEVFNIDFQSIAEEPAVAKAVPIENYIALLLEKQNQLMERQNEILENQTKNIAEKVDAVDRRTKDLTDNVDRTLATVRTLSLRQVAMGETVLNSLERLEKKKKDELVLDAGKRTSQMMKNASEMRDNVPVKNR